MSRPAWSLAISAATWPGQNNAERTAKLRGLVLAGTQYLGQGRPARRVLGQAVGDQAAQRPGDGVERGLGVDDAVQHHGRGAGTERRLTGGGKAQDRAEREHVAGRGRPAGH